MTTVLMGYVTRTAYPIRSVVRGRVIWDAARSAATLAALKASIAGESYHGVDAVWHARHDVRPTSTPASSRRRAYSTFSS